MLERIISSISDLILPRVCVVCGRTLLPEERSVCLVCLADLPLTRFELLPRNPMADTFNARIEAPSYAWATALFHYSEGSGYDLIPQAVKYRSDFEAGRRFGRMLGEVLSSAERFSDVDVVVPVPLHWTRRYKRGYNQAEVIASALCPCLKGAVLRTDILVRARITRTQTKAGREGRAENVKNAFSVRRRSAGGERPHHILIVDDVFTTGSTVAACQAALYAVFGPETRISVATLAYAGE